MRIGPPGKGRACWIAYGYVLASQQSDIIALHDCDIVNYERDLLARLVYPIANPSIDFEFCKGFYARVTDRMHGRVTRLLMTPATSLSDQRPRSIPVLVFMDSFRYPLAGEFAMKVDLARANRIPPDWGLEVGVLAEVFRNCAIKRICQVDLCDSYEHKHQILSPDDPEKGLLKMTVDICKNLFRTLAAEGVVLDDGIFNSLLARYMRMAEDTLRTISRRCFDQWFDFRPPCRGNCAVRVFQGHQPGPAQVPGRPPGSSSDPQLESRDCRDTRFLQPAECGC